MIFTLTFKTPDVVEQLTDEYLLSPDESFGFRQVSPEVQETLDKFLTYNEYLYVKFDTVKKTAEVITQI